VDSNSANVAVIVESLASSIFLESVDESTGLQCGVGLGLGNCNDFARIADEARELLRSGSSRDLDKDKEVLSIQSLDFAGDRIPIVSEEIGVLVFTTCISMT